MWQYLTSGGPVMFILLLCSVAGVYIAVQKYLFIKSNDIVDTHLIPILKQQLQSEGKLACLDRLQHDSRIISKILAKVIQHSDLPKADIQTAIKLESKQDIQALEKNMDILSTIITVAPILGLLGTVLGLIDIFNVISGGGIGDPNALSGGIAEALISTVSGLSITIPFIFCHQFLSKKIELYLSKVETCVNEVLSFCKSNPGVKA